MKIIFEGNTGFLLEAVAQRCLVKNVFLKIVQNFASGLQLY